MSPKPFLVDGEVPAKWKLKAAVLSGREISVGVLPSTVNLEQIIRPFENTLRKLQIAVGAPEADYSFLEEFTSLRSLDIWASSTRSIDFSKMNLYSLSCRAEENFRSLVNAKELRVLHLENASLDWLPVSGRLEELSLYSPRKALELQELLAHKSLKTLDLTGRQVLDLSPLEGMRSLTKVDLSSFSRVDCLDALKFLPNLEVIALEEIGEVLDSSVLDDLVVKGVKVHVVGRQPWAKEYWKRSET